MHLKLLDILRPTQVISLNSFMITSLVSPDTDEAKDVLEELIRCRVPSDAWHIRGGHQWSKTQTIAFLGLRMPTKHEMHDRPKHKGYRHVQRGRWAG